MFIKKICKILMQIIIIIKEIKVMEAIGKNYVKNILSDIFCLYGVNCVVAKQMSSSNGRATEDTSMIVHTSCSIPI